MMKTLPLTRAFPAVFLAGVSLSLPGVAEEAPAPAAESPHALTATLTGTTNYLFRGISQTDNGPAIQGSFDYEYKPYSLYAGIWGSNVSSAGFGGANMELDLYAGWRPTWDNIGLNLGVINYRYPTTNNNDNNTFDFQAGLSYDFGVVKPSFTTHYSGDWYGLADDAWYYDLTATVPLPMDFSLKGHYGWNRFDSASLLLDYQDWSIGVSRPFYGFNFDLSFYNVSGIDPDKDCFSPFQCGKTLVFAVSRTF